MKKILFTVLMVGVLLPGAAQVQVQVQEKDRELVLQAENIRKKLSLDDKTEHLVYNVLKHVKSRIEDVPQGQENYARLIGYIDDERVSMMKSLLSPEKYKIYEAVFDGLEKEKINNLIAKNDAYVRTFGVKATKITSADVADDNKFAEFEEDKDDADDDTAAGTGQKTGQTNSAGKK
jgi:hypothetical protein